MIRIDGELPVVYLKAGELYVTTEPTLIVTVLGSCLTVTMFHRRKRLGGMCHGLYPRCRDAGTCTGSCEAAPRYVACAIRQMAGVFDRDGVRRSEIEVKCFGGADLFSSRKRPSELISVGRQNVSVAEEVLTAERLKLTSRDVGGNFGRKIFFYSHTGEVLLKRLSGTPTPPVA